jgi:hypothetical protein
MFQQQLFFTVKRPLALDGGTTTILQKRPVQPGALVEVPAHIVVRLLILLGSRSSAEPPPESGIALDGLTDVALHLHALTKAIILRAGQDGTARQSVYLFEGYFGSAPRDGTMCGTACADNPSTCSVPRDLSKCYFRRSKCGSCLSKYLSLAIRPTGKQISSRLVCLADIRTPAVGALCGAIVVLIRPLTLGRFLALGRSSEQREQNAVALPFFPLPRRECMSDILGSADPWTRRAERHATLERLRQQRLRGQRCAHDHLSSNTTTSLHQVPGGPGCDAAMRATCVLRQSPDA